MIDGGETIRKLVLGAAAYSGLAALARQIIGGMGAVLMLHRVTALPETPASVNQGLCITPAFLDALLGDMKAMGYEFVTLDEAVERIRAGGKTGLFATITSDDGYRDNLTEALPVFEKHETPFIIYVAPALIDGTVDIWWQVIEDIALACDAIHLKTAQGEARLDCSTAAAKTRAIARLHSHLAEEVREEDQRSVLRELAAFAGIDADAPRRQTLMNWDEVRTIAAHPLGSIGAHTVHHYNLARLSRDTALTELVDGARIIGKHIGETPRHLAYPYGSAKAVGAREVELAQEAGYVSAVTTRHGLLQPAHSAHLHALPRISVNGRYQNVDYIRTMLSGVTTPMANRGKRLVTV